MVLFLPATPLVFLRFGRPVEYTHKNSRRSGCILLVALLAALTACAQTSDNVHIVPHTKAEHGKHGSAQGDSNRLRVDVEMVLVPVTVTDVKNHPVVDLKRHNFTLFEGKSEEKIQYFVTEGAPLSVGILVDLSSSIAN